MPKQNVFPHHWIRLAESFSSKISGLSEVPRFVGWQIIFLGSPACAFLLEKLCQSCQIDLRAMTRYKLTSFTHILCVFAKVLASDPYYRGTTNFGPKIAENTKIRLMSSF